MPSSHPVKRALFIVCLTVFIGLPNLQPVLGKDAPASAPQLLKEFEAALKSKDKDALLALANWQGVSADMKSMQMELFADLATNAVKSVKLLPLPADFQATNEVNGVRYKPNVSIIGLVDVQFTAEGNSMQMPYGKQGGAFYLAGTTEEKVAAPARKEKSLNIMVMGDASPDAGTFSGSCVYVKAGKDIAKEFSGKGNGSEAFWGDYIKSCTVQKTSEKAGSIRLVISENGKQIYESDEVETKDPIVYKRK